MTRTSFRTGGGPLQLKEAPVPLGRASNKRICARIVPTRGAGVNGGSSRERRDASAGAAQRERSAGAGKAMSLRSQGGGTGSNPVGGTTSEAPGEQPKRLQFQGFRRCGGRRERSVVPVRGGGYWPVPPRFVPDCARICPPERRLRNAPQLGVDRSCSLHVVNHSRTIGRSGESHGSSSSRSRAS